MEISKLDHLVLTVKDIHKTSMFYQSALGMQQQIFGENRVALKFGDQKINLHQYGNEFEPKAYKPTPGSADLCLITLTPLEKAMAHIAACGVEILEGPVERSGANGKLRSFYIQDPDKNLIEVANEV